LDRKGRRNIYLLLKAREEGHDVWRFPQGPLQKGELLHEAAQRDLHAECGALMDSWIVSRKPIGVYRPLPSDGDPEKLTFFLKAHIMAGQCRPQDESVKDFAWLTKQEIQLRVDEGYWDGIRDILSDY
jgi:large subunit ribosomal protein L46